MARNYELIFASGLKIKQKLTQIQLYDLIRKYKIIGYKKI